MHQIQSRISNMSTARTIRMRILCKNLYSITLHQFFVKGSESWLLSFYTKCFFCMISLFFIVFSIEQVKYTPHLFVVTLIRFLPQNTSHWSLDLYSPILFILTEQSATSRTPLICIQVMDKAYQPKQLEGQNSLSILRNRDPITKRLNWLLMVYTRKRWK